MRAGEAFFKHERYRFGLLPSPATMVIKNGLLADISVFQWSVARPPVTRRISIRISFTTRFLYDFSLYSIYKKSEQMTTEQKINIAAAYKGLSRAALARAIGGDLKC